MAVISGYVVWRSPAPFFTTETTAVIGAYKHPDCQDATARLQSHPKRDVLSMTHVFQQDSYLKQTFQHVSNIYQVYKIQPL